MTQIKTNNDITISNKRLSVLVSLTGLSFFISNQNTKETLFFKEEIFSSSHTPGELLIELENAFSNIPELQGEFYEINVIYATNIYTVVPSALFDENKASSYLKFNAKLFGNDFVAFDTIENYEMVVVYIPFMNINNYIFERFGSFKYFHSTSILLRYILDSEKNSEDEKAFVHVSPTMFDLVLIKKGSLELCNTYSYSAPEDFIYYILFGFEQLGLNPETTKTQLLGSITEDDDNYKIAYQFIRNITVPSDTEYLGKHTQSSQIPSFFLLNNL